jgi:hypothetical protein
MKWAIRESNGNDLEPTGSKFDKSDVKLTESVNGGDFKPAGNQKGGFTDVISPDTKTAVQRFSVDGKQVQVVIGKDAKGNLIKSWEVRVTVTYPNPPAYSPNH